MMTVAEALALILPRLACVVESETVPLERGLGRVLAEAVVSPIDVPAGDNSAVDGFALHFDDLNPAGETRLPVVGRAAAGHPFDGALARGKALRIFTGAAMPEGADTVMMQEDCRFADGKVTLTPGIRPGANRRRAGEDVAAGEVALAAGRRLKPADLGLAAALGRDRLAVRSRLRVALLSTGDEVREPGAPLPPGAIYDANRVMLASLLRRLDCRVSDLGICADREAGLVDRLAEAAAAHDLIVTSGGVSTGEEDHVRSAIERLGRLDFWRLAIKPGRPVALGQVKGVPLLGLPGNPVAAALTFAIVGRPLILHLAGAADGPPATFRVRAGFAYKKRKGRREYVRATLQRDGDGVIAHKYPKDGAGILSSIVHTQGFAIVPETVERLAPGDAVEFLPYAEILG